GLAGASCARPRVGQCANGASLGPLVANPGAAEQAAGPGDDVVGGEAELRHGPGAGRRGAEVVEGEGPAVLPDPALPAEAGGGLDGEPGPDRRGQDLVAVALRLALEELPGGHADHAGTDAVGGEAV